MKTISLALITCILLLCSCDNSSKSKSDEEYPINEQRVVCPMCGGTGIFEYMHGDAFAPRVTCGGCNGNGSVTVSQAREIQAAMNQVNSVMGGGDNNSGRSGRSASDIEYDLRKARTILEGMERDYANCTSVVLKAQYPNMIANQKQRIAQLEAELRNAR